jgi:nicotinamide-nucleotide amidase
MAGARNALTAIRTAEILAVGTELLTPFRLDTNSLYLTAQLNDLGIDVRSKSVVPDHIDELAHRVRVALDRVDLVITSGGLGPTSDDLTREAVASVLGLPLVEDATLAATIRQRFEKRGMTMPASNLRQAAVPAGAQPLPNSRGTAPGLWIEAGEKLVVLLPGPPRELQPMFETSVRAALASRTGHRRVWRRVIRIALRAESQVEDVAYPIYAPLADGDVPIETTILASPGLIELHLSARGDREDVVAPVLEAAVQTLAHALQSSVVSVDGRSLEETVGALLRERQMHVATAESCTGGLLAGRLTDVSGSSDWFVGGIVAYANEVKTESLDVPASLITEHGAVSEPVARAMADGVRQRLHADVGIGITGIAGPSGGTAQKPVGTVVIAIATPQNTTARTFNLGGDRAAVRQHSVIAALELLRRALLTDAPA